jgi:hypothetical protein
MARHISIEMLGFTDCPDQSATDAVAPAHWSIADADTPAVRFEDTQQHSYGCGLAGAIRAKEAVNLSLADGQSKVVNGDTVTVALND